MPDLACPTCGGPTLFRLRRFVDELATTGWQVAAAKLSVFIEDEKRGVEMPVKETGRKIFIVNGAEFHHVALAGSHGLEGHRIDVVEGDRVVEGPLSDYSHMASIRHMGATYGAVTAYYEGDLGVAYIETVFELKLGAAKR